MSRPQLTEAELTFARAVAELDGDRHGLAKLVAANAAAAVRTARWCATLPIREISLPPGAASEAMLTPLRRTAVGLPTGRVARAVLQLPTDGSYRAGRHRQALRTNIRRAISRGVVIERTTADQAYAGIDELLTSRGIALDLRASELHPRLVDATRLFVAHAEGRTVAYSIIVVSGTWAWLRQAHAEVTEIGSDARWLLHAEAVDALASEGCTSLLVESAIGLPDGHRYFQRRTGFEAVNLRIAHE